MDSIYLMNNIQVYTVVDENRTLWRAPSLKLTNGVECSRWHTLTFDFRLTDSIAPM